MRRIQSSISSITTSLLLILLLCSVTSCIDNEEYANNPRGNFEALWKIMDEHYCFFSQKGIDWQEVHQRYAKQFDVSMNEKQQFEVLTNMLSELKDGHVNLYTSFNIGRYWAWRDNYPKNYSDSLERKYLKSDYLIASGLDYTVFDDNIGYIRCESFQNPIGAGNLDDILLHLQPCNGLIIDVRNNGGGQLSNAEELAARFTNKEELVGYIQHKTGPNHNDFSSLQPEYLTPGKVFDGRNQSLY